MNDNQRPNSMPPPPQDYQGAPVPPPMQQAQPDFYGAQPQPAFGAQGAYQTQAQSFVSAEAVSAFFTRVYGMMITGLGLTAATAWMVSSSDTMLNFLFSGYMPIILFVLLIGMCFGLQAIIFRLPASVGAMFFYAFAILEGVCITPLMLSVDPVNVIAPAFGASAAMFVGLSAYGMVTKRDLGPVGTAALMILLGVIVLSIMNIFFIQSSGLGLMISYGVVVLIAIITAYDTQKLKQLVLSQDHTRPQTADEREFTNRIVVLGAFHLFLDFIIMFVHLVRIIAAASSD